MLNTCTKNLVQTEKAHINALIQWIGSAELIKILSTEEHRSFTVYHETTRKKKLEDYEPIEVKINKIQFILNA